MNLLEKTLMSEKMRIKKAISIRDLFNRFHKNLQNLFFLFLTDETTGISSGRRVPSHASEASYSMDSFEHSYVTENGEVVVLGEDDLPHSQSLNHSREEF